MLWITPSNIHGRQFHAKMQCFHGLVTVVLWELITIHRFDTMLHDFQEESVSQSEIPTYLSNCTPKRQKTVNHWLISFANIITCAHSLSDLAIRNCCQTRAGQIYFRMNKILYGCQGAPRFPFFGMLLQPRNKTNNNHTPKNRLAVLPFQLQDVHDEMFCSPVDGWMQFMQSQLVLQHIFLLIVDLTTVPSSPTAQKNGSTGGYGKSRWKLEHVSFSISHKPPAPPSLWFAC